MKGNNGDDPGEERQRVGGGWDGGKREMDSVEST